MKPDDRERDAQHCPSCEATLVQEVSVVGPLVWLVCGRCSLRWSIQERRVQPSEMLARASCQRTLLGKIPRIRAHRENVTTELACRPSADSWLLPETNRRAPAARNA